MKLGGFVPGSNPLSQDKIHITPEISLTDFSEDDYEFSSDLFKKIKIDELNAHSWASELIDPILDIQHNAFSASIKSNFPDSENFIIHFNGERAGQIIINQSEEIILIVFIAVAKEFRSKGIATAAIKYFVNRSNESNKKIHLHVANNNGAYQLYKSLGFGEIDKDDIGSLLEYN